jgi:tRNA (guanine37-N1)-methyltransferase
MISKGWLRGFEATGLMVMEPVIIGTERRQLSLWHRKEAIELVEIVPSLEQAIDAIRAMEGEAPLVMATDASKQKHRSVSYERARGIVQGEKAVILIFGTAWGLDRAVIERADYVLDPVLGRTDYNHLSVRTAAAIILDRVAGWQVK